MSILPITAFLVLLLATSNVVAQGVDWQRTYGSQTHDWGMAMAETEDGGFLAVGGSEGFRGPEWTHTQAIAVRISPSGDTLWQKAISSFYYASAMGISLMPDGTYLVIGNAEIENEDEPKRPSRYRLFVTRIDSNGTVLSERAVDSMSHNQITSARGTSDGGFITTGGSSLTRFAADGTILWQRDYSTPDFYPLGWNVRETNDGGFIAVGACRTPYQPESDNDLALWRTDADGTLLWKRRFVADSTERGVDVIETASGGYLVIAEWTHSRRIVPFGWMVFRTDSSGNGLQKMFDLPFGSILDRVERLGDSTLLFAGRELVSTTPVSANSKVLLIRTGAEGDFLTRQTVGEMLYQYGISQMFFTRSGRLAMIGGANDGVLVSLFGERNTVVQTIDAVPVEIDLR